MFSEPKPFGIKASSRHFPNDVTSSFEAIRSCFQELKAKAPLAAPAKQHSTLDASKPGFFRPERPKQNMFEVFRRGK